MTFFILPASLPQSQWCCPRQWWSQKCSMCLESSSVERQKMVWVGSKDTSAWEDPEFTFRLRVVLFLSPEIRRPWSWGHTRQRREQWRLCSGASVRLHMPAGQSNTENTKVAGVNVLCYESDKKVEYSLTNSLQLNLMIPVWYQSDLQTCTPQTYRLMEDSSRPINSTLVSAPLICRTIKGVIPLGAAATVNEVMLNSSPWTL